MWHSCEYTHTGKVRTINEDAVLDLNASSLWMVADGMGGHSNGDYASSLLRDTCSAYQSTRYAGQNNQQLLAYLAWCNTHLIKKATDENAGVIGSTIALLQARSGSVKCTWSGDSRVYRLRQGELRQLTQDQSEQAAMENRDVIRNPIAIGEASQALTSAIGGNPNLELAHAWYTLANNDAFLLCTDGLNKDVSDAQIQQIMQSHSTGDAVLDALAELYHAGVAKDNVGMVYARYQA